MRFVKLILFITQIVFVVSCSPTIEEPINLVCIGKTHTSYKSSKINDEWDSEEKMTYKFTNVITTDKKTTEWTIREDGKNFYQNTNIKKNVKGNITSSSFIDIRVTNELISLEREFLYDLNVNNSEIDNKKEINETTEINRTSGYWTRKIHMISTLRNKNTIENNFFTVGNCEKVKENKI